MVPPTELQGSGRPVALAAVCVGAKRSRADVHASPCLCGNSNQQNLSRLARPASELFKVPWMKKTRSPGGSARATE